MQAAFFALKSFSDKLKDINVGLKIDNVTTVAYIKNIGGSHSKPCNYLARQNRLWCIDRNIWLTASHMPGVINKVADRALREFNDSAE